MNPRRFFFPPMLALAALVLVGCSGDNDEPAAPAVEESATPTPQDSSADAPEVDTTDVESEVTYPSVAPPSSAASDEEDRPTPTPNPDPPVVSTYPTTGGQGTTTSDPSVRVVEPGTLGAIEFYGSQWETVVPWRDGWAEFEVNATGRTLVPRDSEIGRLFSDEVHDAIEAAGATEVVAAYEAIVEAGLLDEVLAVLNAHPEARDAVLGGGGELTLVVRVSDDADEWTRVAVPYLGPGRPIGTYADSARIAMLFADSGRYQLAETTDLSTWTITPIQSLGTHGVSAVVEPVGSAWFLATESAFGPGLQTWVVDGATVTAAETPFEARCCHLTDSTDSGIVVAGAGEKSDEIWFSADGADWVERDNPGDSWLSGIAGVDGGVLVTVTDPADYLEQEAWRGDADGTNFVRVNLPAEVGGRGRVTGHHAFGLAELIEPPGTGRGQAIKPPIPHVTEFEHGSHRFTLDYHEFQLDLTVTDIATGNLVAESTAHYSEFGFVNVGPYDGDYLLSADLTANGSPSGRNDFVARIPTDVFEDAEAAALDRARDELGSLGVAFYEERYILVSDDGIEFWGVAVDEAIRRPYIVRGSRNGDRMLVTYNDETIVVDLAS